MGRRQPVRLGPCPEPGAIVDAPDHDVVVWAGESGRVTVCEARCPHQWSHFAAEGTVVGEQLVCMSHMWRFDASGAGWKQAMSGRCDPKADVDVFRSEVRDGEVWAWLR